MFFKKDTKIVRQVMVVSTKEQKVALSDVLDIIKTKDMLEMNFSLSKDGFSFSYKSFPKETQSDVSVNRNKKKFHKEDTFEDDDDEDEDEKERTIKGIRKMAEFEDTLLLDPDKFFEGNIVNENDKYNESED